MAEPTQKLGRYELIKRIAVGGMGVIYLAKSRGAGGFEKTVIIKKILEHLADEPEFIAKFLDEGRTVVHLTHGNIVPVFDMGSEGGEYFIAMDYVPGRDLRDVLKRLSEKREKSGEDVLMPMSLAVFIAIEACKGLDYAHRCAGEDGAPLGIVHRDVSPSNILISRDGEVKIIDFGIARATSRVAKTMTGRIQGKVCYMSPEQASGKPVDRRSDVFSTGVVLYEMLTGVRVFQGDSDLQSLDYVRQCVVEVPSTLNPEIPPELDAIVLRALAADRQARYQTSDALHVALLEWLYGRGRAVTSQQLAEFVSELFPEGFERKELRRARDPSSLGSSENAAAKLNLDDALNAEFAKLGALDTLEQASSGTASVQIDPLDPTAENSAPVALVAAGKAGDAQKAEVAVREESAVREEDAPSDSPDSREISALLPAREHREKRGFKRWMFIALLLGSVVGVAGVYFYLLADHGEVVIRTDPPGASIRVDGVKVAGATTPHTLELEVGEHIIDLRKDGFREQNLSVMVDAHARRVLDGGTIALQPLVEAPAGVRQAWITAIPAEATITIDNGAREERGQAKIEVAPDEQVLVSVSHPGCQTRTEVVTYRAASRALAIELACDDVQDDAQEALAANSGRPPGEKTGADKTSSVKPSASFVSIRFLSEPPGARFTLDGEPIDGPQRIKVGRELRVEASLAGYKSAQKTLRVGRAMGPNYAMVLEKLPTGCVLIRPRAGQQVEVLIDGASVGRTAGAKFDVPAGAHQVELIWGDKSRSRYDISVVPGATCSGPLGFEPSPKQ